jgi:hypothetical protein
MEKRRRTGEEQKLPDAEQAAIEALKKADEELGDKIAKLEEDEKQLASLDKLLEKVEHLIKEEQQVRLDTAKHAVKPDSRPVTQISKKQQETGEKTAEAQKEAQEPVPSAAQQLGEAKTQMNDAGQAHRDAVEGRAATGDAGIERTLRGERHSVEDGHGCARNSGCKAILRKSDRRGGAGEGATGVNSAGGNGERAGRVAGQPAEQQQAIAKALANMPGVLLHRKPQTGKPHQSRARTSENNLKRSVRCNGRRRNRRSASRRETEGAVGPHRSATAQQKEVKELTELLLAAQQGVSEQAMQMPPRNWSRRWAM